MCQNCVGEMSHPQGVKVEVMWRQRRCLTVERGCWVKISCPGSSNWTHRVRACLKIGSVKSERQEDAVAGAGTRGPELCIAEKAVAWEVRRHWRTYRHLNVMKIYKCFLISPGL